MMYAKLLNLNEVGNLILNETSALPAADKMYPVYTRHIEEVDMLRDYISRMLARKKEEQAPYDNRIETLTTTAIRLAVLRILLTHPKQEVAYLSEKDFLFLKKVCQWTDQHLRK